MKNGCWVKLDILKRGTLHARKVLNNTDETLSDLNRARINELDWRIKVQKLRKLRGGLN